MPNVRHHVRHFSLSVIHYPLDMEFKAKQYIRLHKKEMLSRTVRDKFCRPNIGHIDKATFKIALYEKVFIQRKIQTDFYPHAITRQMKLVVALVVQ